MGLEFKHLIYVVALGCVAWALTVSVLVSYDKVSESVVVEGELTYDGPDKFFHGVDMATKVEQVLSLALPLAVLCIAYLAYTYKLNPIGLGSIIIIVLGFLFATNSILDAKLAVELESGVKMAQNVWWMSD